MKTRTSHLVYLLLWLVVLAAYVTALSMLPHAPNVLMVLPAGLGGIAAGLKHKTKYNAVLAAARRINIQCRFGFVKHVSPVRKHQPNAERADSKDSCAAAALYSHAWLHCICGNRAVSRSRRAARQVLRRSAAHVCKILLMGGTY